LYNIRAGSDFLIVFVINTVKIGFEATSTGEEVKRTVRANLSVCKRQWRAGDKFFMVSRISSSVWFEVQGMHNPKTPVESQQRIPVFLRETGIFEVDQVGRRALTNILQCRKVVRKGRMPFA